MTAYSPWSRKLDVGEPYGSPEPSQYRTVTCAHLGQLGAATEAFEMDQEFVAGGNATLSGNPIRSGAEYIESLRGRNLRIYLMGDPVVEPVDHPIIRPSINAVAETYD